MSCPTCSIDGGEFEQERQSMYKQLGDSMRHVWARQEDNAEAAQQEHRVMKRGTKQAPIAQGSHRPGRGGLPSGSQGPDTGGRHNRGRSRSTRPARLGMETAQEELLEKVLADVRMLNVPGLTRVREELDTLLGPRTRVLSQAARLALADQVRASCWPQNTGIHMRYSPITDLKVGELADAMTDKSKNFKIWPALTSGRTSNIGRWIRAWGYRATLNGTPRLPQLSFHEGAWAVVETPTHARTVNACDSPDLLVVFLVKQELKRGLNLCALPWISLCPAMLPFRSSGTYLPFHYRSKLDATPRTPPTPAVAEAAPASHYIACRCQRRCTCLLPHWKPWDKLQRVGEASNPGPKCNRPQSGVTGQTGVLERETSVTGQTNMQRHIKKQPREEGEVSSQAGTSAKEVRQQNVRNCQRVHRPQHPDVPMPIQGKAPSDKRRQRIKDGKGMDRACRADALQTFLDKHPQALDEPTTRLALERIGQLRSGTAPTSRPPPPPLPPPTTPPAHTLLTQLDRDDWDQNQLHQVPGRLTQLDRKELDRSELDRNELDRNELDRKELDRNELDRNELDRNEVDQNQVQQVGNSGTMIPRDTMPDERAARNTSPTTQRITSLCRNSYHTTL
eukprot:6482646-Amphidinium_carterae.1